MNLDIDVLRFRDSHGWHPVEQKSETSGREKAIVRKNEAQWTYEKQRKSKTLVCIPSRHP